MSSTTRVPFPVGVRAITGDAVRRHRRLADEMTSCLEEAGFDEIVLPLVDFADPYAGLLAEFEQRRTYRFTGRDGELITVRSDFTPMVARVVAPVRDQRSVQRLYYRGDVIRCEASRLGRGREFFQIGAELVGAATVDADVEMMVLAARLVAAGGGSPVITVSDASLLPALLSHSSIPSRDWPAITAAVRAKRRDDVAAVARETRDPEAALLTGLLDGELTLRDLQSSAATRTIGVRLQDALDAAATAGVRVIPVLDDVEAASYYSGIRFTIHATGVDAPVGRGGRYDGLYGRFGADAPAVGFTLTPELLLPSDASEITL